MFNSKKLLGVKSAISGFFSWRGPPGKMVDAYAKYQKWYWITAVIAMTAWISYDMGSLVTRADVFNANSNIKGVISVDHVIEKSTADNGGRIIIISQTDARFIDVSGSSWAVPGFAEKVSKSEITSLKKNGVIIDGDVSVVVEPVKTKASDMVLATVGNVLVKFLFLSLYLFLIYIIFKQLGPSKNRFKEIHKDDNSSACIDDVAGYDEVKLELLEIIDYLKDPSSFIAVGARPPKGVLLYGAPGNGKTLMAKAVAGEASASFYEQSASSFIQIFAGAGAKSVRKLFDTARKNSPSVIFIDEIDSVGASRDNNGNDERVQTLNAILTEMDGFKDNTGIVVIAATNRLEVLDNALVRPGRFDRKVFIPMPNQKDRLEILKRHAQKIKFETDIDWDVWASQTRGFSGAEISALINEAAIEAARLKKIKVTSSDLIAARDRVWIGVKSSGQILSDNERKVVAIHEAGHAIVKSALGGKIEKISIAPRGMTLGVTVSMVESEKLIQTAEDVNKDLCVLLAGRAAEQITFGVVSSTATDDINKASNLARSAIPILGSSKWGSYVPEKSLASDQQIDVEASELINNCMLTSIKILNENKILLKDLSEKLIEMDDLSGQELLDSLKIIKTFDFSQTQASASAV